MSGRSANRFSAEPVPQSKRKMSPLPSSTYHAEDFWARVIGVGMPVPRATMNISSGASFSVRGYQASGRFTADDAEVGFSAVADDITTTPIRTAAPRKKPTIIFIGFIKFPP